MIKINKILIVGIWYFILHLTLTSCNNSISNKQYVKHYNFEHRDTNFVDTIHVSEYDKERSFAVKRFITNDTLFIDSSLVCYESIKDCEIQYTQLSNGNWLIFFNNKWSLFFDKKKRKLEKVIIVRDSVFIFPIEGKITEDGTVIPYGTKIINNVEMYGFRVMNISVHEPENNSIYWFEPQFGIIAIENPSGVLVRTDFSDFLRSLSK